MLAAEMHSGLQGSAVPDFDFTIEISDLFIDLSLRLDLFTSARCALYKILLGLTRSFKGFCCQ
jgi:hypothetical protein